jgi:hypothetical protein
MTQDTTLTHAANSSDARVLIRQLHVDPSDEFWRVVTLPIFQSRDFFWRLL